MEGLIGACKPETAPRSCVTVYLQHVCLIIFPEKKNKTGVIISPADPCLDVAASKKTSGRYYRVGDAMAFGARRTRRGSGQKEKGVSEGDRGRPRGAAKNKKRQAPEA